MRFSIALLSLAASIVSAGYIRPTPIYDDEDCKGLTSVDFEFALGVKECDEKHVTVFDLVFEIDDGQLEHDGCHLVTCESCYSYPTQEPIGDDDSDCEDCDDKKNISITKRGGYGETFGNDDDKYCEIERRRDVDFFKLCDTVITDEKNRLGEIVTSHQFQFDPKPGQSDALIKKGFTIVEKDDEYLLALKGKTTFFHCRVDDNGLYKIYDEDICEVSCDPIELVIIKAKEEKNIKNIQAIKFITC